MTAVQRNDLINDRYKLLRQLGAGGFGEVHEAFDRLYQRPVALKRLKVEDMAFSRSASEKVESTATSERLVLAHEFQVLSSMRHPHIISVMDYGFDQEAQPYFTMNLVERSRNILETAQGQRLEVKIDFLIQMLQALSYLHRRGMIHSDLKPDNALVTADGVVKVLDFGLATQKRYDTMASDETNRQIVGTLAYIAPELLQGAPASEESDLYAVGIIAYELLAGRHPFRFSSPGDLIAKIMREIPDITPLTDLPMQGVSIGSDDSEDMTVQVDLDEYATELYDATMVIANDADDIDMKTDVIDSQSQIGGMTASDAYHTVNLDGAAQDDYTAFPKTIRVSGGKGEASLPLLVARLLEKKPTQRYHSADEVIAALSKAVGRPLPKESVAIRESFLQAAKFVGRQHELTQLKEALAQAQTGVGSAWLIGGESGVGKSRLLSEMRTQAMVRGFLVLHGQAIMEGGLSYQIWREPLRRLVLSVGLDDEELGVFKDIIHDIGELLEREVDDAPPLDGQAGQQRLFETIGRVFERYDRPIMLVLEDLQWTVESRDVLKHLLQSVGQLPLLIVGSFRSDEAPHLPDDLPDMQVIRMGRLPDDHVADLCASMLGDAGRQARVLELVKRETEGNVFFIIEVIRALAEEVGRLNEIGGMDLPTQVFAGGIQQIIERRLHRVTAESRPLLRAAAVYGRELDVALLHAIAPTLDLDQWLVECSNAAVIDMLDQQWRFAHDKLREGLLGSLSSDERQELHLRIAAALELVYADDVDEYAAKIADHYERGGKIDESIGWYLRAGHHAQGQYAPVIGIAFFRKVMAYWDAHKDTQDLSVSELIKVLHGLGTMLTWQAAYDEAIDIFEQMEQLAAAEGNLVAQSGALYGVANIKINQGELREAVDILGRAVETAEAGNDKFALLRALWLMGVSMYRLGDAEATLDISERVLALAEALDDQSQMAQSYNLLGAVYYALGDYDKCSECFEGALTIFQERGEHGPAVSLVNNLGFLAEARGDYEKAHGRYLEALEIAREIGFRDAEMLYLSNLGGVRVKMKQYEAAENDLQEVIDMAAVTPFGQLSETYRFLAAAYVGMKRSDLALDAAREAMQLGREVESPEYIACAWRVFGQVAGLRVVPIDIDDGDGHLASYDAVACFAESERLCREGGMESDRAHTVREWAKYEIAQGNRSKGEQLWNEARESFIKLGAEQEVEMMREMPS